MRDVEQGLIDVIVVYKIDRLTRSLHDFSKLVDVFERMNVSFVSVTQEFNTTHSMGRLMLNILLSFAQFEREVTAERIRDKVAVSKRKGIWMGGVPALGYDVKNRRLVVNQAEARTVKHIFERFADTGSATTLAKELKMEGVMTKSWTTQDGRFRPGRPVDKGFIYKLLHNRVYLGEIHHKTEWYPGKHEPIIDSALWDRVHTILATHHRTRANQTRAQVHFLLKGLVFDTRGRALTPYSTSKKKSGKRYRYYVSTRDIKEGAGASDLPRFPATEFEERVMAHVKAMITSPELVGQVVQEATVRDDTLDEAMVTVAMTHINQLWDTLFPDEQSRIINLLVERVVVRPDSFDIHFHNVGVSQLALEMRASA